VAAKNQMAMAMATAMAMAMAKMTTLTNEHIGGST
jgi:hypothetical protein